MADFNIIAFYNEAVTFPTGVNDCRRAITPYSNLILDSQIVFNISTVPDTDKVTVFSSLQSVFDCCVVTITINVDNDCFTLCCGK